MKKICFLALFTLMLTLPGMGDAFAEEYVYERPGCEFQVTFPGEPYQSERCNPANPDECQILTSYTRVFDMRTSMDFKLTCNPVKENMFQRYSGDVMKTTLTALARSNQVQDFQTYFKEYETMKQAALIGEGKQGVSPKLYMAQMWIGRTSILVIEGALIGQQVEEYEKAFANILASVRTKSSASSAPAPENGNQDTGSSDSEPPGTPQAPEKPEAK